MNLFIDSTNFNSITYACSGNRPFTKAYVVDPYRSHETLGKLQQFLKAAKIAKPSQTIKKIIVNSGPGSYTGTRVGVTHALALGFVWNIPVKAIPKEKFTKLVY